MAEVVITNENFEDEVVKSEDNKIEGEGYEYYTGRNEKIYVGRVISGRYAKAK